jgi:hypothetical protein
MRFNEFKPLLERQRPQLPRNVRVTRPAKPGTTAPADPFGSMASSLTSQNTQPAPMAPTQSATSTGGIAKVNTNPDGTASTTHIADPNNPNVTKPSFLNRIGNSLTKAFDFSKQGKIDSQTQKIFIDKFNKTMDYNIQSAQQQGMKFNLKGFVDGYMAKNNWKPGQLQSQLDHAVATNDRRTIPGIMAQIGKANTAMYSPTREPEIAGAFGDAPVQAAPTQSQTAQSTPEQPAPPLIFGGKTIDPSSPLYAKVLSMMQQQGVV